MVSFVTMSIFFTSLNSGSNGNCYYIGNASEAVLIDAGLSCKETEKRMKSLDLSMELVKAIFISHEHIDHVKGVEVLAKKYGFPVHITNQTLQNCRTPIPKSQAIPLMSYNPVSIGNLIITAFPKFHDAIDPTSFIIEYNSIKVGVFTDIGSVCDHVIKHFKECNAVFLEANYDEYMLENGHYPFHLKKRISGNDGHLSNKQALDLFTTHQSDSLSHLLLSHLSQENNDPKLVLDLFKAHSKKTEIILATRHEHTALYAIESKQKKITKRITQLNLFQ